MADASFVQSSFLGGEWSKSMQGRIDRPDYRSAMNLSQNGFPTEQGSWVRRGGTGFIGPTRQGLSGRSIGFDFNQDFPYSIIATDGYFQFVAGNKMAKTNDRQAIVSISADNPAIVTTGTHTWSTGNIVLPRDLGINNPKLANRMLLITVTSSTTFTIADAITGTAIDGSAIGTFVSGNVERILEYVTPYVGGLWASMRAVLADIPITGGTTTPGAVLLQASVKPYVLQVSTQPTSSAYATFSLAAAPLEDGPYLDPVAGGTLATPSALIGNITLALSFSSYDATRSYSIGDYVVDSSVNYRSLTDANVGHTPAGSPSNWVAVSAADAINSSHTFQGSDVGRHVRLYSEPALWAAGTTYAKDAVVAYGGAGLRSDGAVYWIALVGSNLGNIPGADITKWALYPNGARWTWGKIVALSNVINRATGANIGTMTGGGGLAAAFDGVLSQAAAASAELTSSALAVGTNTLSSYVGKNYTAASDQIVAQVIVYPSNDTGLAFGSDGGVSIVSVVLNLRGKASVPLSASDGTLLGTSGAIANTTAPVTIVSTDQATAWKFLWVEQVTTALNTPK